MLSQLGIQHAGRNEDWQLLTNTRIMARHGHSLTSTSHRLDSGLNRLAAEMGCKGGEEGGNAPVLGQTVQAPRLPPIPARTPHTRKLSNWPM